MSDEPVVIVGASHAGFHLALYLRQLGYAGSIQLINNESSPPYQRPPLSKAYLTTESLGDSLLFRPLSFFAEQRIELVADNADYIDRAAKTVTLSSGKVLSYKHLVLATGARNRKVGCVVDQTNVYYIRSLDETSHLREQLKFAQKIAVIGAGFIGLEFAAAARKKGANVQVIEFGTRVMQRAVTPSVSEYFQRKHEENGVQFQFNCQVTEIKSQSPTEQIVYLTGGKMLTANLIVAGIGAEANSELASKAGLVVSNGVLVDHHLITSDRAISAIGDCATFSSPHASVPLRIESVQNASDQARCVAERLAGKTLPYQKVPWFWSDQGSDKLQIVGLTHSSDKTVLRGSPESGSFSVFCYRANRLIGIESVNRVSDHVVGRKMLELGHSVSPEIAGDLAVNLRSLSL